MCVRKGLFTHTETALWSKEKERDVSIFEK